jgi:ABC-type oligopeptide transport system substrate-binding subunit
MKKMTINKTFFIASSIVFTCLFSCTDQKKTTASEKQIKDCDNGSAESSVNTQQTPITITEEVLQNLNVTSIVIEAQKIETPAQETVHLTKEEPILEQSDTPEKENSDLAATLALKTGEQTLENDLITISNDVVKE